MGQVSASEARELIAKNEVDVVDLREEDDWVGGHIPGAHRGGDDLDATIESLEGDRKLLLVCADGKRSGEVADELDGEDREAASLEGGMEAWNDDGLPTQPSSDYEPGPATIEEGDDEMAAEIAEGTIDPDSDGEDGDEAQDGDDDQGGDEKPADDDESAEAEKGAEDAASEPVEGAEGEESPQQERAD